MIHALPSWPGLARRDAERFLDRSGVVDSTALDHRRVCRGREFSCGRPDEIMSPVFPRRWRRVFVHTHPRQGLRRLRRTRRGCTPHIKLEFVRSGLRTAHPCRIIVTPASNRFEQEQLAGTLAVAALILRHSSAHPHPRRPVAEKAALLSSRA